MEIINFLRDWDKISKEAELRAANYIETGLPVWDEWFGGVQRGELQLIAAASGCGKTTFLMAMAKELVNRGHRVLYVSSEQTAYSLAEAFGKINLSFIQGGYKEILEAIDGADPLLPNWDIIVYDYIGAEGASLSGQTSEWQVLRNQAEELSNIAIDYQIAIITATQADYHIYDYSIDALPSNNQFVSFSKHIINKVSAAAYLVKDNEKGKTYLKMFKNRHKPFDVKPKAINLNYSTKSFN